MIYCRIHFKQQNPVTGQSSIVAVPNKKRALLLLHKYLLNEYKVLRAFHKYRVNLIRKDCSALAQCIIVHEGCKFNSQLQQASVVPAILIAYPALLPGYSESFNVKR